MSSRPGNPNIQLKAATALGVAGGLSVALNNGSAAVLTSFVLSFVASATVGNRNIVVQFKDAAGNILTQTVATTAITAGQTPKLVGMAGIPYVSITTPLQQIVPLPNEVQLPPFATMQILDTANIDTADTVAVVATVTL
jgi:hypothetical protein